MQKKLKKILDELNKEVPRLDYVRGMVEMLVEQDEILSVSKTISIKKDEVSTIDEGALLDAKAKASLETIKNLSQNA